MEIIFLNKETIVNKLEGLNNFLDSWKQPLKYYPKKTKPQFIESDYKISIKIYSSKNISISFYKQIENEDLKMATDVLQEFH